MDTHGALPLTRRQFLGVSATAAAWLGWPGLSFAADEKQAKQVAAIVTEFTPKSHAECIVGRWLEGFELDGKSARPRSKLVGLYTDQVPTGKIVDPARAGGNDISRALAEKHKVPIYRTVREALCQGGDKLAVDGVLLIGEFGNYPINEKGQKLYPRRRFFEETVKVFRDSGRVVPVFSDKHLSYSWENAKWMYDQAVELKIPFMAGSSLPGTWRLPAVEIDAGSPIEAGLVVAGGGGGIENYGFHLLEALQCLMERRKGGETGVVAVTCLEGQAVWKAGDDKQWSHPLMDAALAVGTAATKKGKPEDHCKNPVAFLVEYKDGRRGSVLMLSGHTGDILVAVRIAGKPQPWAVNFWLEYVLPYGHFIMLTKGIEAMFQAGKPTWPVERTLLTTGILDAALTSRFEQHKRLETPHLAIAYAPGPAWKPLPATKTGPPPTLIQLVMTPVPLRKQRRHL